ncbi:SoxR reducing system RseC family protein [Escherichia coli]
MCAPDRTVRTSVGDNPRSPLWRTAAANGETHCQILSSGQHHNDRKSGLPSLSWQNGQALVSCDVKASCSSCASRAGCGRRVLNKLQPKPRIPLSYPDEPLVPGQKVELGIAEGSLLSSALLVYMSPPLVDYSSSRSLFQLLFASDVAALCRQDPRRYWRVPDNLVATRVSLLPGQNGNRSS